MRKAPTRSTLTLAAVAVAVLLAACGGDGGTPPAAADGAADGANAPAAAISIVATEFAYDPDSFSLPADTPVEITLDNQGVIEHDITIDEGDVYIYAGAGETTSGEVTLPAGTYDFYCDVPGHRASGMEGTITVE